MFVIIHFEIFFLGVQTAETIIVKYFNDAKNKLNNNNKKISNVLHFEKLCNEVDFEKERNEWDFEIEYNEFDFVSIFYNK